ncbi:type IV conjugative transfer system lipoprotein TraV [Vibrio genomosp. F6]|jgi:conjugal transfer pilus assembly protein TraV|uniref:Type IV conjugative transfer system protein TraV n=1 Tax=Vibrio genomosp. F6 str. FF-238 TaxID=1191298 RepID=A0A1E5CSI0_9VIBR|nr:type IV conjugative transfer system lipoprotein TraV [Vibrio genomosp. F6]OEE72839.1 type IV conjugative transfer system protein TraV [Vibrio genomosp. F6 str. FF-238]
MNRIVLLSLVTSLLTGCAAGLDGDYSCEQVGGIQGCTSMADIRENMDVYSMAGSAAPSMLNATALPASPPSFTLIPRRDRKGQPIRTEEEVRKVTIFPFKNQDNFYIDTFDIFFVLDDSRWSGRPASSIWKD